MSNPEIKQIAYDTIIYGATKFALHETFKSSNLHAVDAKDLIFYLIADGVYIYWVDKNIDIGVTYESLKKYNMQIEKAVFLMLGVSAINVVAGRTGHVVDNLISIGVSSVVERIVDDIRMRY